MEFNEEDVLSDFDIFFYYGKNELSIETKSDVIQNIVQPKRSLFYDRALDSSGAKDYENVPEGLALRVNMPYDIVKSIAKRNQFVSNGENGSRDRRVALSQSTINVKGSNNGEIDVEVLFIPLADFKQTEVVGVSLGV